VRTELEFAGISAPPAFTVSFGVADTSQAADVSGMLRVADAALYRAKADGRNRVVVASATDVSDLDDEKKLTPAMFAAARDDDPLDGLAPSLI
jgi:predicted signal transduction protein with EAL and GGDEF domain